MWLEGEVHEQERKILQSNYKEEEKGRGLCLGCCEVVLCLCQGSNLPAQSRREEKEQL